MGPGRAGGEAEHERGRQRAERAVEGSLARLEREEEEEGEGHAAGPGRGDGVEGGASQGSPRDEPVHRERGGGEEGERGEERRREAAERAERAAGEARRLPLPSREGVEERDGTVVAARGDAAGSLPERRLDPRHVARLEEEREELGHERLRGDAAGRGSGPRRPPGRG